MASESNCVPFSGLRPAGRPRPGVGELTRSGSEERGLPGPNSGEVPMLGSAGGASGVLARLLRVDWRVPFGVDCWADDWRVERRLVGDDMAGGADSEGDGGPIPRRSAFSTTRSRRKQQTKTCTATPSHSSPHRRYLSACTLQSNPRAHKEPVWICLIRHVPKPGGGSAESFRHRFCSLGVKKSSTAEHFGHARKTHCL